jgi:hypothetical protein
MRRICWRRSTAVGVLDVKGWKPEIEALYLKAYAAAQDFLSI